ncbi:5'-3' exoribonuclease 1 [Coemansia sp. RSA 988]|nr:5'-3' exoribonuclease 1 [Coemansia sp. RSA 988]
MGVPGLYRYLQQQFPSACTTATRLDTAAQTLFVDLNSTIHREARQSNGNMGSILSAISDIVSLVRPTQLLFLAIDGVPPRIKERLQRERRARSSNMKQLRKSETGSQFQAYMITPGTQWMRTMEASICELVANKRNDGCWGDGLRVVLSGTRAPGEGEHKIFECLRLQQQKLQDTCGRHVVWSGDADTLFLALGSRVPRIFVVNERHMEVTTFSVTDIDKLRTQLVSRFASGRDDSVRAADDLIFLALLAGNDFLPPLALLGASTDAGGIGELWALYQQVDLPLGEYLHDRGCINTAAMVRLLRLLVQRIEDRHFRRYIAATSLGTRVSAMLARRSRWAANACGDSASLPSDKPQASKRRVHRQQLPPPLVCVGRLADLAKCRDVAQGPAAQPIGSRQPHFMAPENWPGADPVLALDGRPLTSLAMLLPLRWMVAEARDAQSSTALESFESMGDEQLQWLRLAAVALGQRLQTNPASKKAVKDTRRMVEFRLVHQSPPPDELLDGIESGSLAVVSNETWDMLLADAQTQQECDVAVANWSAAMYGPHASATARTRLSHNYALALAWTAQYYFGTGVSSWTFAWPEDIDISAGVAPLPSDLLAYVERQLANNHWPKVKSDEEDLYVLSTPLPREHMLCVLPPDAAVHSDIADLRLAKLLYDSKYSETVRAQVRLQSDITETPQVEIWL